MCLDQEAYIKEEKIAKRTHGSYIVNGMTIVLPLLHSNLTGHHGVLIGTSQSTDSNQVREDRRKSDHLIMRTIQNGDATRDITYDHESYANAVIKEGTNKYCERWKKVRFT